MKNYRKAFTGFCLIFFLAVGMDGLAQKPEVDTSTFNNWPEVSKGKISDNGEFVKYNLTRTHNGLITENQLIVESVRSGKRIEISDVLSVSDFSADGKFLVCRIKGDSLCIIHLPSLSTSYDTEIVDFDCFGNMPGNWIFISTSKLDEKTSRLVNLETRKEITFRDLTGHIFNNDQSVFAYTISRDSSAQEFRVLDLRSFADTKIWEGYSVENIVFDGRNRDFVFLCVAQKVGSLRSICYYNAGTRNCNVLVDGMDRRLPRDLYIASIESFVTNDQGLLLRFKKKKELEKKETIITSVDIWNYKDAKLQSEQLKEIADEREYAYLLNMGDGRLLPIEGEFEHIISIYGKSILLYRTNDDAYDAESNWNPACLTRYYMYSIVDGTRAEIPCKDPVMSMDGKYVIWYDITRKCYKSYTVDDKKIVDITPVGLTNWTAYGADNPKAPYPGDNLVGWPAGDTTVVLYDQYDIWEVGLRGG